MSRPFLGFCARGEWVGMGKEKKTAELDDVPLPLPRLVVGFSGVSRNEALVSKVFGC